ncbi:MAG: hypothetical protein HRF43_19635 [Phycisphaerae bacterium]|jgi:hypothetical protein
MSLVRMAGLIALPLVATTLQAHTRPAEAARPSKSPSSHPEKRPVGGRSHPGFGMGILPARENRHNSDQASAQGDNPESILVLTPNLNAWGGTGHANPWTGGGPEPQTVQHVQAGPRPLDHSVSADQAFKTNTRLARPGTTRPWLTARYPHAPPVFC